MPQIDLITFFGLLFSLFIFFFLVFFFDSKIFSVYLNFQNFNREFSSCIKFNLNFFLPSVDLKELNNNFVIYNVWVEKFYFFYFDSVKKFLDFVNKVLLPILFLIFFEISLPGFNDSGFFLQVLNDFNLIIITYFFLLLMIKAAFVMVNKWIFIFYKFIYFNLILSDFLFFFLPYVIVLLASVLAVAFVTLSERKGLAGVQRRQGPAVVGPFGLLQPIADAAKLLMKQTVSLKLVNKTLYKLAPLVAFAIPFPLVFFFPSIGLYHWMSGAIKEIGLLVLLSVMTIKIFSVVFSGWASNSKYPLLGCVRSVAQLIAYELSFGISILAVAIDTGSFSTTDIIQNQRDNGWYFFRMPLLAVNNYIAMLAESNRTPFDNLESESELVSGYNTEYSSWYFAAYFLAEYLMFFIFASLFNLCFLGGSGFFFDLFWYDLFKSYQSFFITLFFFFLNQFCVSFFSFMIGPINLFYLLTVFLYSFLNIFLIVFIGVIAFFFSIPVVILFLLNTFTFKVIIILFSIVVLRGVLPRERFDQLMVFGWKYMLPITFGNLIFVILNSNSL